MQLRPRFPRQIWLLAAAAWLAGCALIWWALPVGPQMQIACDPNHLGFSPDGQNVLTGHFVPTQQPPTPTKLTSSLQLKSVKSGRLVANLGQFQLDHVHPMKSPDGRYWMVRHADEFDDRRSELMARFVRFDVMAQTTTQFRIAQSTIQNRCVQVVSPSGGFCVLRDRGDKLPPLLWQVGNDPSITRELEIKHPMVFSGDGRFLAAQSSSHLGKICVVELQNAANRKDLMGPDYPPWNDIGAAPNPVDQLRISSDGTSVAARFITATSNCQTYCWNVETEARELMAEKWLIDFTNDGSALIVEDFGNGGRIIEVIELTSGGCRTRIESPATSTEVACLRCQLSPDGRTVLATTRESSETQPSQWGSRFGSWWPFPKSGERARFRIYDLATGGLRGDFVTGNMSDRQLRFSEAAFRFIPDGRIVTLEGENDSHWSIWNVPPTKSLGAFAIRAAILTALIAIVVVWQVQRRLSIAASRVG